MLLDKKADHTNDAQSVRCECTCSRRIAAENAIWTTDTKKQQMIARIP